MLGPNGSLGGMGEKPWSQQHRHQTQRVRSKANSRLVYSAMGRALRGGDSVGKVLRVQGQKTEFSSHHPHQKKLDTVTHAYNLSSGEAETESFWEFVDQIVYPNHKFQVQ